MQATAAHNGRARWIQRLSLAVIALSLATMFLGPLVRAEHAGLACPDWPLCHGEFVPWDRGYQVFLEFIHRVFGGLTALALLGWFVWIARDRELRAQLFWPALGAVLLMINQILLGALTITAQLDAYVVKSHLLNAVLFLGCVVYVRQKAKRAFGAGASGDAAPDTTTASPRYAPPRSARITAGLFALAVFLQLFLGGRVSTNYAGYVCPAFPACYYEQAIGPDGSETIEGVYFPPMVGNVEKHMTHRFMGYAIALFSVALVALAYRQNWDAARTRFAWLTLWLVLFQIVIGVLNVLNHVPVTITVLHSFVAYMIMLCAFVLWLDMRFDAGLGLRQPKDEATRDPGDASATQAGQNDRRKAGPGRLGTQNA